MHYFVSQYRDQVPERPDYISFKSFYMVSYTDLGELLGTLKENGSVTILCRHSKLLALNELPTQPVQGYCNVTVYLVGNTLW